MEFDLKPWLEEQPFEIEAWSSAVGLGPLVTSTIIEIIGQLAPPLAKFSPGALDIWRSQQEVAIGTAQWVTAGTDKRATVAIARGAELPFGKALAQTGVLADARIRCLIADNARTAPKPEKE